MKIYFQTNRCFWRKPIQTERKLNSFFRIKLHLKIENQIQFFFSSIIHKPALNSLLKSALGKLSQQKSFRLQFFKGLKYCNFCRTHVMAAFWIIWNHQPKLFKILLFNREKNFILLPFQRFKNSYKKLESRTR